MALGMGPERKTPCLLQKPPALRLGSGVAQGAQAGVEELELTLWRFIWEVGMNSVITFRMWAWERGTGLDREVSKS